MADLLLQNSKGKTWCEPSLSFGMQTGTVRTPDIGAVAVFMKAVWGCVPGNGAAYLRENKQAKAKGMTTGSQESRGQDSNLRQGRFANVRLKPLSHPGIKFLL